jgi:SAM-dependent methyltransferase
MGSVTGFKDHFSGHAAAYAAFRPRYPAPLFAYLAERCRWRGLAWDCGTGSGQAAVALAGHFEHVIATDASAAQLAHAAAHPRIGYAAMAAERAAIASAAVDLITVAQGVHRFDLEGFYGEVNRVLRPQGVIAVWAYGLFGFDDRRLGRLLAELYRRIEPYWPPQRQLIDAGYRTLPFPFAEVAAPQFSMAVEWTLEETVGYLGTWSAVQAYRRARGEDPLADFLPELESLWRRRRPRRRISWPLYLRVGRRG